MKKLSILLSLTLLVFAACKNDPASTSAGEGKTLEEVTTPKEGNVKGIGTLAAQQEYMNLSPSIEKSYIQWTGSSASGSSHTGTIKLLDGGFHIIRGNLKQGSFTINMGSITVNDLSGSDKADLEGHLKGSDFFDISKFPTGQFVITGITLPESPDSGITHNIKGELTMKGIAKEIPIPLHVELQGDNIMVTSPEFTINRTDWDIKYKSGLIGTVKDKIINDEIKLKINVVVPVSAG
jgi:polyisoprenoid-binding protein YceI